MNTNTNATAAIALGLSRFRVYRLDMQAYVSIPLTREECEWYVENSTADNELYRIEPVAYIL